MDAISILVGGCIGIFSAWLLTRLGKFSNDCDKDSERMFRKRIRDRKKRSDQDPLSEHHEEL